MLRHFFNSIYSLPISVSHFGNADSISNPPPAKRLHFPEGLMVVSIFLAVFFRHNAIAHLTNWSIVNITLYTPGNQKTRVTGFLAILTLWQWSGPKTAASPRAAYR